MSSTAPSTATTSSLSSVGGSASVASESSLADESSSTSTSQTTLQNQSSTAGNESVKPSSPKKPEVAQRRRRNVATKPVTPVKSEVTLPLNKDKTVSAVKYSGNVSSGYYITHVCCSMFPKVLLLIATGCHITLTFTV